MRGILKTVAAAVAAGLLAAGAGYALTGDPAPAAEVRMALTTEVYWPYYDAVRQEIGRNFEDPGTVAAMGDAAGDTGLRVTEVQMTRNQSFLDVRVEAATEQGAVAGLSAGVDRVLAADLEAVNREPLRRFAALEAEATALGEQLDATPEDDPDRGTLELRYFQLLAELDELRPAIETPAGRVAVLAGPAVDDPGDVRARNAAIAGVVGFLVALTALRAFGPWRRADPPPAA